MNSKSGRLSAVCVMLLVHSLSANVFYTNNQPLDTVNESVKITTTTLNTICSCDKTRNACDVKCCCDPDCKDMDKLRNTYNFLCTNSIGDIREICYHKKYLWTVNERLGFTRLPELESDDNLCVRVSTDQFASVIPVDPLLQQSVKDANTSPPVESTSSKRTTVGFQLQEELFTLSRA